MTSYMFLELKIIGSNLILSKYKKFLHPFGVCKIV